MRLMCAGAGRQFEPVVPDVGRAGGADDDLDARLSRTNEKKRTEVRFSPNVLLSPSNYACLRRLERTPSATKPVAMST